MQKAVGDFIYKDKVKFFIPFYQRGYRWEKEHIEALLNDLWDFYEKILMEEEGYKYYSLQPLVVKYDKNKTHYRVVDGQQRLTTIFLLLSAIEDKLEIKIKKFDLEYERDGSEEFLKNIKNKSKEDAKDNIDFYYIYEGFNVIKNWLDNKSEPDLFEFKNFITRDSLYKKNIDIKKNIRFMWYEIDYEENKTNEDDKKNKIDNKEFDVFIRLNIGKIPLTNAELIKSYLLQTIKNKDYRREIANEWDNIEYSLAKNEFFGFLTTKNYKTKIELLFQILLNLNNYKNYELYEKFINEFSDEEKVLSAWKKLKNIFYTLNFWYENREFYHLIGYLISSGEDIVNIYNLYENSKDKEDFKFKLKEKIKKTLTNDDIKNFIDSIDELSYSNSTNDKKFLMKVFLLFNVLTLINSSKDSYIKFSFYRFNKENWSIEHITPQTDKKLDFSLIKKELVNIKDKLNNKKLNKILSKNKIDEKDIKELEKIFSDDKILSDRDNIRNLTLLSFRNNSSLKNNFFPLKRNLIINMDKRGEFIPIVTKNLFLKYYSDIDGNPEKWTYEDGEKYINSLKKEFEKFFIGEDDE